MAFWDIIKELRKNDEEEKKRRAQGGFSNRIYGFLDDTLDTAGNAVKAKTRLVKKVAQPLINSTEYNAGILAGAGREIVVKPIIKAGKSLRETQLDERPKMYDEMLALSKAERERIASDPNDKRSWRMQDFIKNNGNLDDETIKKRKEQVLAEAEKKRQPLKPKDGIQKTILGNEDIFSVQGDYRAGKKKLQEGGASEGIATSGGALYGGALALLDSPFGMGSGTAAKQIGKKGMQQLAKSTDKVAIEKFLTSKLGGDVATKISQQIAETTDPKQIKKILNSVDRTNKPSRLSVNADGEASVDELSKGAKNTFENAPTTEKPGGIDRAKAEIENGTARPVRIKYLEDGTPVIEDGRHRVEAARQMGLKTFPIEDVTNPPKNTTDEFLQAVDPAKYNGQPPKAMADRSAEEADLLSRIHSTSEIEAAGTKKKSIGSKVNEQWFDKNAPMTAFAEAYKARTGRDLPSDLDPKAIMQLSNGNDAAAKLQLEPVTKALTQARNIDDVKILGTARHILNRRDSLPAETVARAEAAIRNMESRLGKNFQNVDSAVQSVVDFNHQQLQRLVDAEIISPESYKYMREANPDYFGNMGLVEHLLTDSNASKMFGGSGSHNRARENIIKAIKGFEDDTRFEIRDPIENIARTAAAVQKAVKDRELFTAIGRFESIDKNLAFKQRASENVLKRMGLSVDNKEMRPVRDKLDRMMKTRGNWVKKLQTQANNLEKKAYQVSLKKGGSTMPEFTPGGLGGEVSTAKATNKDMTKTVLQTPAEKQLMEVIDAAGPGSPPPKLGPKDTQTFLRNLVQGPPTEIARLRKQISTRDVNAQRLLDEIESMRAEYDDLAQRIASNSEEAKALMDKELPKGMKVITSMKNGIQERIAVQPEIQEIYAGLNAAGQDIVNTVARKSGQITKEALTTYNPAFALVTNPIRDVAQGAFRSKEVPLRDYLLIVPYAAKWLQSLKGTLLKDATFKAVTAAGGGNSGQFVDDLNPEKFAQQVRNKAEGTRILGINSGVVVKDPKDFIKLMAKVAVSPIIGAGKVIKGAGTTIEATTRGVEARAALKNNKSLNEAALGNRRVSTDFLEGGHAAQVTNQFLNFFNARIQGTRNVVEGIKADPKRASVLITAGIAVPTATVYAWNSTKFGEEYDQVDQSVKDNNFVLFFGHGTNEKGEPNEFITLPKNDIQKFFATAVENGMRTLRDDNPEEFSTVATKMLGGLLPIDVVKDGEFNASRAVGSILPPALKAPIQVATNKNFYNDSPIVPDNLKGLPAEEQVRDTTSPVDKFIANLLPGEQSPLKINSARTAITGNLVRNPVDNLGAPLTAKANAPQSEFYRVLNKTAKQRNSASNKINDAIEAGDITEARRIADEYNQYVRDSFKPWAERYKEKQTPQLLEIYNKQKINLTKRSISQRRTTIEKKQALENASK